MNSINGTPRIVENTSTSPLSGNVSWAPRKSIWYLSNLLVSIIGGYYYFSWSALALFTVTTSITLCLGHSLGMHRRLIHNSYECPLWLEYMFVHFGVLVGMAGPIGMVHQHDLRDWAQRKPNCHSFLRHGETFLRDGWWQLNCDLLLKTPPEFSPEPRIQNDKLYRFMEKTWMLQQLPWALLFFYIGGLSWVIWGISVRIAVSVTGHWLIGYFAHNNGQRDWHIEGAAAQGYNLPFAAYLTMGESWHNNHHSYPGSAVLGIYKNQPDPGWWVLNRLINMRLAWNVKLPEDLPARPELLKLDNGNNNNVLIRAPQKCPIIN